MKKIKIFIGSSIDELKSERKDLVSFIQTLNNRYIDRGIFFESFICEEEPSKMAEGGSQNKIDKYIENDADVTFFMFFSKAGEYTLHELDVAWEFLKKNNRPDVYIFFKTIGTEPMDTEEIKKAVDKIAKTYGHYYKNFKEIDTVKLEMLQYISEILDFGQSIEIEDGKIYFDGVEMRDISLDNIFAYQNNKDYQRLKKEIANLIAKIKVLAESGDVNELIKLNRILEEKKEQFSTLEKTIISVMIKLQKGIKRDKNPILIEAFKLAECGEIQKALEILPSEKSIKLEAEVFCKKHELAEAVEKADAEKNISEAKARIEILKTDIANPDRFDEIIRIYDDICKQCEIIKDLETLLDEIRFLYDQNHIKECFEKANRLDRISYQEDDEIYAEIQNIIFLCDQNDPERAEKNLKKAIEIRKRLVRANPDRFVPTLASSYNNVGGFYENQGKPREAENFYKKAIEILKRLVKVKPDRFKPKLALVYSNIGHFYDNQGKSRDAEECLKKAIEIMEQLTKINPDGFEFDLGHIYNNMGAFYDNQGNSRKAEEYLQKAIEIMERLAKTNPDRCAPDLALTYHNVAYVYNHQNKPQEAERFYKKTIKTWERLTKTSFDKFEINLATSYNSIGYFYNQQGNPQKAEEYLQKAIKICYILVKSNPDRFEPDLARSYSNIGSFYDNQGNPQKAEEYLQKATEIMERLAKTNPDRFAPELASSYNDVGCSCYRQGNPQKAVEYLQKAIKIKERLVTSDPDRFEYDLATNYNNIGYFYNQQGNPQKAEEYLQKATEIMERLAKETPDRVEPGLATSYNNIGGFYDNQGKPREAERFYKKAIEIRERLAKENPDRFEPDLAISYLNMGRFCSEQDNSEKAVEYLQKAIEIAKKHPENQICRQILESGGAV